ncbi:hypothetical protein BDW67DRAFT_145090 [Aspergillus spinulosporus]
MLKCLDLCQSRIIAVVAFSDWAMAVASACSLHYWLGGVLFLFTPRRTKCESHGYQGDKDLLVISSIILRLLLTQERETPTMTECRATWIFTDCRSDLGVYSWSAQSACSHASMP